MNVEICLEGGEEREQGSNGSCSPETYSLDRDGNGEKTGKVIHED